MLRVTFLNGRGGVMAQRNKAYSFRQVGRGQLCQRNKYNVTQNGMLFWVFERLQNHHYLHRIHLKSVNYLRSRFQRSRSRRISLLGNGAREKTHSCEHAIDVVFNMHYIKIISCEKLDTVFEIECVFLNEGRFTSQGVSLNFCRQFFRQI